MAEALQPGVRKQWGEIRERVIDFSVAVLHGCIS